MCVMETCKCVLLRKWFGLALLAALAMAVAGPSWAQTAAPDQITAAFTKNFDLQFTSINRATHTWPCPLALRCLPLSC
jgi:hypothetical protein